MNPTKPTGLGAGLLVVLVLALAACGGGTSARNAEWEVSGELDPSSSTVPIRFEYGPACEQVEGIDVEEDAERVEITVRLVSHELEEGSDCPDIGASVVNDVALDRPLGDRELTGPGLTG